MDESKTATNPEVTLTSVAHTSRDRKVINWRFIGGFWYGALRYFVANKQIEKERFSLFYVFREACLTPRKKKRNLCPTKGRSRSTKNDCALWKYHSLYRIQNTVFNVEPILSFDCFILCLYICIAQSAQKTNNRTKVIAQYCTVRLVTSMLTAR